MAPVVITTQNVLLRKLGLYNTEHVESSDFGRYMDLFQEGLMEDQVNLIRELFLPTAAPAGDGATLEELEDAA
jgi:hypothetical protein